MTSIWKGKERSLTIQENVKAKNIQFRTSCFVLNGSSLFENCNCYQSLNGAAGLGSWIKPRVNFHHYQALYTTENSKYIEMPILFFRQKKKVSLRGVVGLAVGIFLQRLSVDKSVKYRSDLVLNSLR